MAAPTWTGIDSTHGFVQCVDDVDIVRNTLELSTNNKFVSLRRTKNFGHNNAYTVEDQKRIGWSDSSGVVVNELVPFIRMGTYEAGCQFGRDKHAKDKRIRTEMLDRELESDHPVPKRRKLMLQGTKKKGCKASMLVKEVILFPQFKASSDSKKARDGCSKAMQKAMTSNMAIEAVHRMYIRLPDADSHNHTMSPLIGMTNPISDEVKDKIMSLVMVGVSSVSEMRRHLREFVRGINPAPLQTNLAYYPMDATIRRHMYTCQQRLRYSKLDQENVLQYVAEYATANPDDNITFIPATSVDNEDFEVFEISQDDEDEVISITSKPTNASFFFCHQTSAQRQLLRRYGNDICLLDATYRTTKYALPLFFLAVPTNVGYMVVGEFIVENESKASIKQGLETLKRWMEEDVNNSEWEWKPRMFMTDFCEAEINALEETFEESMVLLCDFHREQSWSRWLSKTSNGLSAQKDQVTVLLRRCAHAIDVEEYNHAISQLHLSPVWRESTKLRNWFSRKWIPENLRWVWAFRLDRRVMVNTNNGIERQNKDFKYAYLEQKKSNSLAGMITVLLTEYLPSKIMRYMKENIVASQLFGRLYHGNVPEFLHDRPQSFVRHCIDKMQLAQYIEEGEIQVLEHGYKVRSQSDGGSYDVLMDNGNGQPSCTCRVWLWERLPCKHMFAVIQHHTSWDSLPFEFRDSPFFTLDDNVLDICPSVADNSYSDARNMPEHSLRDLCTTGGKKSKVNQFAAQCREQLSLIRTNTYLCKDEQVLQTVHQQLKDVSDCLLHHLKSDSESGLIEEEVGVVKGRRGSKRKPKSKATDKEVAATEKRAAATEKRAAAPQKEAAAPQKEAAIIEKEAYATRKRTAATEKRAAAPQKEAAATRKRAAATEKRAAAPQKEAAATRKRAAATEKRAAAPQKEAAVTETQHTVELIKAKALVWKTALKEHEWQALLKRAIMTSILTLDEVSEVAHSVLSHLEEDKQAEVLVQLQTLVPSSMAQTARYRLINLILHTLVEEGHLKSNYDVKGRREEMARGMKYLANASINFNGPEAPPLSEGSSEIPELKEKHQRQPLKSALRTGSAGSVNPPKKLVFHSSTKAPAKQQRGTVALPFGGLPNPIGYNVCFANATLQCLRTTNIEQLLKNHVQCDQPCLICLLKTFFEDYPALSSLGICKSMQAVWPAYRVGTEEDAHEMLTVIMEQIQRVPGGRPTFSQLFEGEIESSVCCSNCNRMRTNNEVFNNLSLSIKNCISLGQSLSNFFHGEEICGYKCQSCGKCSTSSRKYNITRLPTHLIVHLKRFDVTNVRRKKDSRHIQIEEFLNLKCHVKPELRNTVEYKGSLCGVIVHYGSLTRGHYFVFVRSGTVWYKIDDTLISKVNFSAKDLGDAYILFYQTLRRPYID